MNLWQRKIRVGFCQKICKNTLYDYQLNKGFKSGYSSTIHIVVAYFFKGIVSRDWGGLLMVSLDR
jgi:hypothetical protein